MTLDQSVKELTVFGFVNLCHRPMLNFTNWFSLLSVENRNLRSSSPMLNPLNQPTYLVSYVHTNYITIFSWSKYFEYKILTIPCYRRRDIPILKVFGKSATITSPIERYEPKSYQNKFALRFN